MLLCAPNCEAEDLEITRVASLVRNVLSQVSVLSWYMLPFQYCPPDKFAAILHPDRDVASSSRMLGSSSTTSSFASGFSFFTDTIFSEHPERRLNGAHRSSGSSPGASTAAASTIR